MTSSTCEHELTVTQGPKWCSVNGYICSPRGHLSCATASREELHDVLDKWLDAWGRCREEQKEAPDD